MELEGRVAVVTGGARGIGRAVAQRFLEEGAMVVIGDIDHPSAVATAGELADLGTVLAVPLDVRDWDSVAAFYDHVEHTFGRLDVSVNNAGVQAIGPSLDMPRSDWDAVVSVNLGGVFAASQAAARLMRRTGGGSIVNMASVAGVSGMPQRAPYCSSKAAVINLTQVLGVEWAPLGIRVNAIGPGWVLTDLVRAAMADGHLSEAGMRGRIPLGRLGELREIADVALFLASTRSSYITGQTLYPDGGFTATGGWQ